MDSPTYLAKEGKVFGPYDPTKIEELKQNGKFFDYEWMWDGQSPDWSPVPRRLKNPPPLPGGAVPHVATKEAAAEVKKSRSNVVIETSNKNFCAVVFDSRHTMGGEVSQAHSRGGKFISAPESGTPFPKGSTVWLDLLDESNDKSAKIKSVISQVSRMDSRWVFELEWGACPLI